MNRILQLLMAAWLPVAISYASLLTPAAGPNLLSNPDFSAGFTTEQSATGIIATANSAALDWAIFNVSGTTATERCSAACPSGTPPPAPMIGPSLLHISTGSADSGVYQFTGPPDTGPVFAWATVWVYILSGGAEIGIGNQNAPVEAGKFGPITNASTSTLNQWILLSFETPNAAPPFQSPINEMFIYSSGGPSNFFVDSASLTDPPGPTDVAPEPATMLTSSVLLLGFALIRGRRRAT